MKNLNFNVKTAIAAILMTGSTTLACAAQDITTAEAEQINAELAPVVNPEANAEKIGSVPENPAAVVGTRFTYQGTLRLGNDRAQGPYDFRFRLYSEAAGGAQLGSTITANDLSVADGLFSTELDFGQAPIDGDDIFLQIEVRDGASTGAYTILSPRQRINATPYAVRALTGGDGGASPWTITGSNIYYNAGRVGIGTNSPGSLLHVNSTDTVPAIFNGGSRAYIQFYEQGNFRGYLGSWQTAAGTNDADFEIGTNGFNTAGSMHIVTKATPRITVNPDGDVGIGTTSPGAPLDVLSPETVVAQFNGGVNAFVRFYEQGNFRGYFGSWQTATGTNDADFEIGTNATNTAGSMHITTKATPRITVDPDGNVGVGTLNPLAHMHVEAPAGEDPLRVRTNGTTRFRVYADGHTQFYGNVQQNQQFGGILKAAVNISSCGGTVGASQAIDRQYNGVNGNNITATDNGDGKCIIDFPFNVNNRFWSVSVTNGTGDPRRGGSCATTDPDKLSCSRWEVSTGTYITGEIMVLVY